VRAKPQIDNAVYLFKPDVAEGWTTISLQLAVMMFGGGGFGFGRSRFANPEQAPPDEDPEARTDQEPPA